jgi:SAM-dependent methyltransferase
LIPFDATRLPFDDDSVDILYGYAFTHHLQDFSRFLREAVRVTRGRAVFMDDAYSPVWQNLKTGPLRPLMRRAHHLSPISPEDHRATMRGGFREAVLASQLEALGVTPWFHRSGFVHYLVTRGAETLKFPSALQPAHHPSWLRALIGIDSAVERLPGMRRNLIRLVWGFDRASP